VFFLAVRGDKVTTGDWLQCPLTDVVSDGVAPTSLADPWQIHIIALRMVKGFLGVSHSRHQVCIGDILPNRVPEAESKIAVSAEPSGRGFTSQLWRVYGKGSSLNDAGVGGHRGRTLSLILSPSAATSTDMTEHLMYINLLRGPGMLTLIHVILFITRQTGHPI